MLSNFQRPSPDPLWHHMMVAMPTISQWSVQTRLYELELARKYDFITIADWYQVAIEKSNIWVRQTLFTSIWKPMVRELYAQTVKEAHDKAEKGPVKVVKNTSLKTETKQILTK